MPSGKKHTLLGRTVQGKSIFASCDNLQAQVLMQGWYEPGGDRILTRDNENLYIYYANGSPGDEALSRTNPSSPWVYLNVGTTITTSLTVATFPWQASWPAPFTATKVCPEIPPAPSGIFVGSTNYVNVTDTNGFITDLYEKQDPTYWSPGGGDNKLLWSAIDSRWEFRGDNDVLWGYSTNLVQSADYIPTTGWVGQYLGTITITVA